MAIFTVMKVSQRLAFLVVKCQNIHLQLLVPFGNILTKKGKYHMS